MESQVELGAVAEWINSHSNLDAYVAKHGHESYHKDIGEYWVPAHVRVKGDLTETENLAVISEACDRFDAKVHNRNEVGLFDKSEDGWARLVVDG